MGIGAENYRIRILKKKEAVYKKLVCSFFFHYLIFLILQRQYDQTPNYLAVRNVFETKDISNKKQAEINELT